MLNTSLSKFTKNYKLSIKLFDVPIIGSNLDKVEITQMSSEDIGILTFL